MRTLRTLLPAFFFSVGLTTLCALLLGVSLPLFFAPVLLQSLVLPILAKQARSTIHAVLQSLAMSMGAIVVLLLITLFTRLLLKAVLPCCVILLLFNVLHVLSTRLMRFSSLSTLLALLFLTWPIWLLPHVSDHTRLIDFLVLVHPLIAMNGQLQDLGIWTQFPLAYQITSLGQDVPYAFPSWTTHVAMLLAGCAGAWGLLLARDFAVSRAKSYNRGSHAHGERSVGF